MPEFAAHGRSKFFDRSLLLTLLNSRAGITAKDLSWLAALLVIVFLIRWPEGIRIPSLVKDMVATSLGLFGLAHLVLFKLHLPARYVMYTFPLAAIPLLAANLEPAVAAVGKRWPPHGNRVHFWQEAGLYVRWQGPLYAVVSIAKGGVVRVFDRDRLISADNGLIVHRRDGRCLVTHLFDRYEYDVQDQAIRIKGRFGYINFQTFTPWSMLLFYFMMLVLGRFCRNLIRSVLQKLLIVGKRRAALVFQRTIHFQPQIMIIDEIWDMRSQRAGKQRLTELYAGSDHTSIYVAMSNAYQASCLYPWTDDMAALAALQKTGYVKITRPLSACSVESLETLQ